ncbi:MAG: NTP transferase domain-containing protein [Actinomycetia bacterium]|jgi:molybdopterin-guanine dinucleotide biosynthesis protein A|nr:NTP transferase domain-containing protein [Actinomycetes bacterium]
MTPCFDVIVLAGGVARRFGSDKLALLLDRVLDGLPDDARTVVCAGPARPTRRSGVRWVREDPPLGGPLAGLAAGVPLTTSAVVVVVGGDMPDVGRAVPALVSAAHETHRPALLLDAGGRRQPLASAWPRALLQAALERIGPPSGRPLRDLLAEVAATPLADVPDAWGAARDVDVPDDLSAPDRRAPRG